MRLAAAWRGARADALQRTASPSGVAMSRAAPESPGLDGRVPMVIAGVTLHQLRRVAGRSECTLAQVLLAVFGLVLDGLGTWKDTSITVLPSSGVLDRPVREGTGQEAEARAMPEAMRVAISRPAALETRRAADGPAIAFRYVRHGAGEGQPARALVLRPAVARSHYGLFDLVLEVSEFDDRILIECFFHSGATTCPTVGRLLHAYVHNLYVVASSFCDVA